MGEDFKDIKDIQVRVVTAQKNDSAETEMGTVLIEQKLWLCKISVNSISRELHLEVESKYQLLQNFTITFRKTHMYQPTFIHLCQQVTHLEISIKTCKERTCPQYGEQKPSLFSEFIPCYLQLPHEVKEKLYKEQQFHFGSDC